MARIWSIASVAFVVLMVAGELLYPHASPPSAFRDLVGLFLFTFGTCVGMVLAWRWEGVGGGVTLGSILAFYALLRAIDGRFPRGPYFALVAAPGVLFLLAWALARARRGDAA
jgi:uncharacterized membrane protein